MTKSKKSRTLSKHYSNNIIHTHNINQEGGLKYKNVHKS